MQPPPPPPAPSSHPKPQTLPSGAPPAAFSPPLAGVVVCAPNLKGAYITHLDARCKIWSKNVLERGGRFTQDPTDPGITHVLVGPGGAEVWRQAYPAAAAAASPPFIVDHTWLEESLRCNKRVPEADHPPRAASRAPAPLSPLTPAKRHRGPAKGLEIQKWLGPELWSPECNDMSELGLFLHGRYNIERSRAIGNEPLAIALSELAQFETALASEYPGPHSRASSADSAGSEMASGGDGGGGRASADSEAAVVVDDEIKGAQRVPNWHSLHYARAAAVVRGSAYRVGLLDPEGGELPFIGRGIAKQVNEIILTGSCDELNRFRTDSVVLDSHGNVRIGTAGGATRRLFHRLPGVGQTTAARWWDQGLRSYEDVEAAAAAGTLHLSTEQAFSLSHRADLFEGASEEEVSATLNMVRAALEAAAGFDGWRSEVVGGARRGTPGGHDADILVAHPTENTEGVIKRLLNLLISGFDPGDGVWRLVPPTEGMCRLQSGLLPTHMAKIKHEHVRDPSDAPGRQTLDRFDHIYGCVWTAQGKVRRLDVILCPFEEWAFAYLGWVGSRTFLRSQRNYAKADLGMLLNSHGMFVKEGGESWEVPRELAPRGRDKVPHWPPGWGPGRMVHSEEDVFELMGLPYRPPEDRNAF